MIVPRYWAESRLQHRGTGRQLTMRRFGWSDIGQIEAQAHADQRVQQALQRALAGEPLPRRDRKVPYNGGQGVPIREEVVSRHGPTVITRNAYGARCLNTPDALFVDVDFAAAPSHRFFPTVLAMLVFCAAVVAWFFDRSTLGAGLVVLGVYLCARAGGGRRLSDQARQQADMHQQLQQEAARQRITQFLASHPEWNFRLYRTPAGLRVMATHRPFSPNEPAVAECFSALGADPIYVAMCLNQQCFRARVSAKPWRIGIQDHLKPQRGVWPVAAERLPARQAWVDRYEQAAAAFGACSLTESLGSGAVHQAVQPVQELHDDLCAATRSLPIA